jgi:hypothetical protein
MTAASARQPAPAAGPAASSRPFLGGPQLIRLYLASRRVPAALAALAACGIVLRIALHWHWITGSGDQAQELPLVIEAATAAVIAVTTASPFGEPERATGRWLPYLRLAAAGALTLAAAGALAAGAAAAGLGGALGWLGPMVYSIIAEYALVAGWTTPWTWPGRPPHDVGAALCAALACAAGLAVTTVRGARDSSRE